MRTAMKYKKEVKELMDWLKLEQNSAAKLAAHMGYKTSNTISKWIKEKAIPQRQIEAVLEFIRK
jgi:transposase-like protein